MNYVYAGYGISAAALLAYAVRVVWRGRVLRRVLATRGDAEPRP